MESRDAEEEREDFIPAFDIRDDLRVERMRHEEERDQKCRRGPPSGLRVGRKEPDEEEVQEGAGEAVEHEVDRMAQPGGEPGNLVLEREGGDGEGPVPAPADQVLLFVPEVTLEAVVSEDVGNPANPALRVRVVRDEEAVVQRIAVAER